MEYDINISCDSKKIIYNFINLIQDFRETIGLTTSESMDNIVITYKDPSGNGAECIKTANDFFKNVNDIAYLLTGAPKVKVINLEEKKPSINL